MAVPQQRTGPAVQAVIFDLDGTILDTESLCIGVAKDVLQQHYGVALTAEASKACLGKRPLEAWQAVVGALQLTDPTTPDVAQKLLDLSEPLLQARWHEAKVLPGALRLLRHLVAHRVPLALATSTPRATLLLKLANKPELRGMVESCAVCGDEVVSGKPAPDTFLAAARRLGVPEGEEDTCMVVEDAPSGVQGALAAGMRVLLVPSSREVAAEAHPPGVSVLPSLLALQPQDFGLPPFEDTVEGVIPVEAPLYIKGEVVRGFGRGSKELGIPTANVAPEALLDSLADAVTGIWAGWASIGDSHDVHKMVMSIGYNPFYGNTTKTAEPWILADFAHDFYGAELRLVVSAYVRPEANFTSLQALIDRIHEDARITRLALDHPTLAAHASDPWLLPSQVGSASPAAVAP